MFKLLFLSAFLFISSAGHSQIDSSLFTVRLSSFNLSGGNNIARLHWNTACFLDYAQFEIQRSSEGNNFTTISTFTADRLRCLQPFDYVDTISAPGQSFFYRINVGNLDGKFYHSAIRSLSFNTKGFDLLNVLPNVTSGTISYAISNEKEELMTVFLINQSGAIVIRRQLKVQKGINGFSLPVTNTSSAVYWLQIRNSNGDIKTKKIVVVQ